MTLKNLSLILLVSLCTIFTFADTLEVTAVLETVPHVEDYDGGDCDDPAIWINKHDAENSLVIGTLKDGGLDVYDLDGNLVQHIGPNPDRYDIASVYNNVDVTYGFKLGRKKVDLAIVSESGQDLIRIFKIQPSKIDDGTPLVEITDSNVPWVFVQSVDEVDSDALSYGIAAAKAFDGGPTFVFVTRDNFADVAYAILYDAGNGKVSYEIIDIFKLPMDYTLPNGDYWTPFRECDTEEGQAEGLVYDAYYQNLYISFEPVGVFKTSIWNPGANLELVDVVKEYGVPYTSVYDPEEEENIPTFLWDQDPGYSGEHLVMDVEGISIYDAGDGEGYLIVSSQGSDDFSIYDRVTDDYIGTFKVVGNGADIDTVQETDGFDITNFNLGGNWEKGLVVFMDAEDSPDILDDEGEAIKKTNFKYVKWEDLADAFGLEINNPEPDSHGHHHGGHR